MGALGDDDAEIKATNDNWNFNLTDTQPFDSQNFHTSLPGEKEGDYDKQMQFCPSNLHFDDTVPVEDAFETQVLDLDGETQVLDYPDCFGHMDTQLIDDFNSDSEESDTTEVLDDDIDTHRRGNSELSDVEMTRHTSSELEKNKMVKERNENRCSGLNISNETPTVEVSKPPKIGSVPRFAGFRVASFRASGLAARKVTLEKTKSGTSSVLTENQNLEKQDVKSNESNPEISEEANQVCDTGGYNGEVTGLINGKTTKIGSSTMRKLFAGDCFVEKEMLPSMDEDDNVGGNDVAGLSYIDSQEPGDLTQENAFACVERLIEENKALFDECDLGVSTKGKSDLSFAAKGSLSLARKTNQRSTCVKSAFFDFDAGQEDEGGGDIFCRRKEDFLGSGKKSFTKRVKARGNQADGCRDSKEKPINAHSDSKKSVDSLKLNDKKSSEDKMNVTKNLVHEFDEECDGTTLVGNLDALEEPNVGLDTQIAAEAMEALVYGDRIANSDANFVVGNTENFEKGSTGTKAKKNHQKKRGFAEDGDIGVATRQYRRKGVEAKTRKQPEKVNHEFSMNGIMTRRKRARADVENHMIKVNHVAQVNSCKKNKAGLAMEAAKMLDTKGKSSDLSSIENLKSKSITFSDGISCPKRRRSSRKFSAQCNNYDNLDAHGKSVSMLTRSQKNAKTNSKIPQGQRSSKEVQVNDKTKDASSSPSAQDKVKESPVSVPRKVTDQSKSTCTSPVEFMTPVNAASPVCFGDEYMKRSCKRRLSNSFIMKEISSLYDTEQTPVSVPKDMRKRRDLATVRVLFSQHLNDDIIKQQTKIADRLKVSIASSITDATHFIADKFVRTRNILEAIASGKPVVTHLWLENVGCANYYIDEQKYILRDMKKEKELGFNMQISLAHACQNPLLQGRKVLITPNTKPSKEIIAGLVKTVGGQAVERVGRSALKDDTMPDDMLILSCEEDYELCVPFLKKGATVYSSELLLNGIVTQKLEYGRYELFVENVKRTRSTIWLKKGGDNFSPVKKPR